MTPNPSTNSGLSPAELMFMRKIRPVFNKLLPKENKNNKGKNMQNPLYQEKTFSLKNTEMGIKSGRLVSLINISRD